MTKKVENFDSKLEFLDPATFKTTLRKAPKRSSKSVSVTHNDDKSLAQEEHVTKKVIAGSGIEFMDLRKYWKASSKK